MAQINNVFRDVYNICEDYGLLDALKYVLENNHANNHPYHNLYHTLCVTQICHELATEGMNYRQCNTVLAGMHSAPVVLTHDHVKDLIVAALFHDFNHSGGLLSDKLNVESAIEGIPDEINSEFIMRIIQATEYPYIMSPDTSTELGYCQAIIRDADLVQFIKDNSIPQNIFGLYKEMNQSQFKGSLDEFVDGVSRFIDDQDFLVYSNHAMSYDKSEYLGVLYKLRQLLLKK